MGGLARRAARLLTTAGGTQRGQSPSKIRRLGMNYRRFGRTGWQVSEIGYGMWGIGGWTGSDDAESQRVARSGRRTWAAISSIRPWPTATGHSEKLLGQMVRRHPGKRLYTATKIPPKNSPVAHRAAATRSTTFFRPITSAQYDRNEPEEPRAGLRGPDPVPRLGGRLGRGPAVAAGDRGPQAARAKSAPSASASTAGSHGTA